MSVGEGCKKENIQEVVQQHVPAATLLRQRDTELTFTLPFESMDTFTGTALRREAREHEVGGPDRNHEVRGPDRNHEVRGPDRNHKVREPDRNHEVRGPDRNHKVIEPGRNHEEPRG